MGIWTSISIKEQLKPFVILEFAVCAERGSDPLSPPHPFFGSAHDVAFSFNVSQLLLVRLWDLNEKKLGRGSPIHNYFSFTPSPFPSQHKVWGETEVGGALALL